MINAVLGGQPVTVHDTASLDTGLLRRWLEKAPRLLGLDIEGLPFDHEDLMNHYGPLGDRWVRLTQVADERTAWNLDPTYRPHREALDDIFSDPRRQFTTWGRFDPEAATECLGHDITSRTYSGMTMALMLRPGHLETHGLKDWAWLNGMPELREAEEAKDRAWAKLAVGPPRKPVRPRVIRKGETSDLYAERLFVWRTEKLVAWQREVRDYYRRFPLREEARETATGGFSSGWNGWRDIPRDDHDYQLYAGLDPIAAVRLWPLLLEQVKQRGVYRPLRREMALEQAMTRVKIRGTLTDLEYAHQKLDEVRPRHLDAKASFEELTGVKATSPKRIDWLRARDFPFNPKALTKTGNPGLSGQHVKDYLAALAPDEDGPKVSEEVYRALELIKEASETQNLTTFLGGLVQMVDPRGRIHPDFNVLGAETGRWTARKPAVQTFSRKTGTRGIIIPEPGHVLVSIDQAQIEVRVFAALSEDPDLMAAFNRGEDVYGTIALKLFGPGFTKDQRSVCKRILLGGCLYAGGPATIQTQLHDLDGITMSQDKIREVRTDLYQKYTRVPKTIRRMSSSKDVWLPSGRFVPGDPDREYRGTNSFCQGTARDLMVDTLMRGFELGYEPSLRLVAHDEGIFSLPLDDLDRQLSELSGTFRVPFQGVKIDCDVEIYPERWGGRMIGWDGPNMYTVGSGKLKRVYGTLDEAKSDRLNGEGL